MAFLCCYPILRRTNGKLSLHPTNKTVDHLMTGVAGRYLKLLRIVHAGTRHVARYNAPSGTRRRAGHDLLCAQHAAGT